MVKKVIITSLIVLLCTYLKSQDINQLKTHAKLKRHSAYLNISSESPSSDNIKTRLDSIVEYNYNALTTEWDKQYLKDEYTYQNNDISTYKLMVWNEINGEWKNQIKEEYYYTSPARMSSSVTSIFINNNWTNEIKKTYSYINDNLLDESIEYIWDSETSVWQKHTKSKYIYTSDEKIDTELFYDYDDENTSWIVRKKTTYEYINNKLHYINKWIDQDNQWKLNERYWYLYDNIKWLLHTISYYQWYDADDDLKLISRRGFSYNNNDEYSSYSEVSRAISDSQWSVIANNSSKFDYSYTFDELLLPYNTISFKPFYFHHKTTTSTLSDKGLNNDPYIPYCKLKFFYNNDDTSTDTPKMELDELKVFPNPANDILWIESNNNHMPISLELFSIDGTKVLEQKLLNSNKIDISQIKTGIYIFKVSQNNQVTTNKIIIR